MTRPVFYAEPSQTTSLSPGDRFVLAGPEARHAAAAMRITVGERIDVADGLGRRITGTVAATAERGAHPRLEIAVETVTDEPAPGVRIALVQALAKSDRAELAVETATELGVDAVIPWQSDRSIVRWRGDKATKGQQKWESAVRSAAKQSRRSWIPEVLTACDTAGLVPRLAAAAARGEAVYVLHEEAASSLADLVSAAGMPPPVGFTLVVGPEGGISPEELRRFEQAGAQAAGLGPHVLRSSTAGPVALVILNHVLGRW